MPRLWLELDPKILASLFDLDATGEVRVLADGKIQIQVQVGHLLYAEGTVVEATLSYSRQPTRVFFVTGLQPVKPVKKPP